MDDYVASAQIPSLWSCPLRHAEYTNSWAPSSTFSPTTPILSVTTLFQHPHSFRTWSISQQSKALFRSLTLPFHSFRSQTSLPHYVSFCTTYRFILQLQNNHPHILLYKMRTHRIYALLFSLAGPWQVTAQREHQWSTFDKLETPTSGTIAIFEIFKAYHHPTC